MTTTKMNNLATERLLAGSNGAAGQVRLKDNLNEHLESPINKSLLGLLIFLGTEAMFFAGLISAFLILRAGSGVWPPPGQPRLPVAVTAINTLILLCSAYTMHRAVPAVRSGNQKALVNWLAMTGALGTIFLGVQGAEWIRLVQFGLTLTSSLYGATFYTLIGFHGLHVLAAVIALLTVLGRAVRQRYSAQNHSGLELCRLYWFFVVGIWPVLYALVYWNW
jgi:heme/copper-type cytochrome/quinol oxidase subunit 3